MPKRPPSDSLGHMSVKVKFANERRLRSFVVSQEPYPTVGDAIKLNGVDGIVKKATWLKGPVFFIDFPAKAAKNV